MHRNATWSAPAVPVNRARMVKPIACILFIAALGVAFWTGVLWVTMPLLK